jgi:hypothetical protein
MIRTYGLPDPYNNDLYASVLTRCRRLRSR